MGAARLGQAPSDAVIVTVRRSLTWVNAVTVPVWLMVRRVWEQEVAGSNPAAMKILRQAS